MAIQAHIFPENLGLLPVSSQDCFFLGNNFNNMNNNNMLYNGFGLNEFSYNNLQQKLLQQQYQQQQQYMNHLQNMQKRNLSMNNGSFAKKQKVENNTTTTTSTITSESDNHKSLNLSQTISIEIEKQSKEIDRFINLQNERLKLAVQEQRKLQLGEIIKKFEAKAFHLLRQKDDEIAIATKKSLELQEIMNKLELENQAWQKVALENEAMVLSLNNSLEQLKQQQQQQQLQEQDCSSSNCVDDVESCCNISDNNKNNIGRKEETCEVLGSRNVCKVCNSGNACVLMLPCRHLCSCKVCDVVLDACPVCKSPKMASFEALLS